MPPTPVQLRALLIAVPDDTLDARRVVDAVESQLVALAPASAVTIETVHTKLQSTRAALRAKIEDWVTSAPQAMPHLLYFHGHGGRVSFEDLPDEQTDRISYYLQCLDENLAPKSGLLDIELSDWICRLHEGAGGNVTMIVDSCHAGGVVRALGPPVVARMARTPAWIAAAFEEAEGSKLAAESHPGVVRLLGSTPARQSKATAGMGRFTRQLLRGLRELGPNWAATTWTLLAHRVRQLLIDEGGNERQWVTLAGPGDRHLFSLDASAPARAIGLVHDSGQLWIRAGSRTGVEPGDRWAALASHSEGATPDIPRLAEFEVGDEGLDATRTCLGPKPNVEGVETSAAAMLVRAGSPMPVDVIDCPSLELALPDTTWLRAGDAEARYQVRAAGGQLELLDTRDEWPRVRVVDDSSGRQDLIGLLEDRARTARLLRSSAECSPCSARVPPILCELGLDEDRLTPTSKPRSVEPGRALWVAATNTDQHRPGHPWQTYFVAALLIDPLGRPILLNASRPDGVELGPDEHETIGRRVGGATRGIVLDWPPAWVARLVEPADHQRVEVLFLISDRPLQLGHLSVPMSGSDPAAFHMQGLSEPSEAERARTASVERSTREPRDPLAHKLARAQVWGAGRIRLQLSRPARGQPNP